MLMVAAALLVQNPSDSSALRHAGGRAAPTMTAVRIERPRVLDGKTDDPAWHGAKRIGGFIETDPREESSPAESTTVMIVYDDAAVYVGARLYDAESARISRRLGRRDVDTQSDMFYVDFDSYHDHRTAFEFAVNPAGVKEDDICSNDFFIGDRSWDPVWDVATSVDSLGWVVEMRIPFSQLRFPHARDQVWGVNFFRWVFRKNERSQWAFQRKTETGYASRFGHLVGLHAIPAPKRLEVLPYTLGRGTFERPVFGSPFDRGHSYFGGAGLDVKYGVTSNLTLDAAVNPDFGQVEFRSRVRQPHDRGAVPPGAAAVLRGRREHLRFRWHWSIHPIREYAPVLLFTPHRPCPVARTGCAARRVHRPADARHHPRGRQADG